MLPESAMKKGENARATDERTNSVNTYHLDSLSRCRPSVLSLYLLRRVRDEAGRAVHNGCDRFM
jgi:hypothetical protein